MKQIDHLAVGNGIRFRNVKWAVTDKDEYVESADYRETQWTLLTAGKRTAYLIQSDENTDHGPERIWIFSRPVPLESVRYKNENGDWMLFEECGRLYKPPQVAALGETIFTLQGETSGQAEDDDGNMVTKLTWDYYDESGARNLAIEVWKEEDGDYPEAYDGESISPDEVEILDAKEVAQIRRVAASDWQGLGLTIAGAVIVVLFLWGAGIPLDVCLAGAVPITAVFRILKRNAVVVGAVAVIMTLLFGVVMFLMGGVASFWVIAILSMVLGVALRYSVSLVGLDAAALGGPHDLLGCFLPALWMVSFYMYFVYAPGPRDGAQLGAAVLVPVVITAGIYLVNYLLGRIWPSST